MAKTRIAPDPNVGLNMALLMERTPELGSQPALAKKAGIAQSTVGRILRNESAPTGENLRRIAEAFGIDVGDLYRTHALFKESLEQRSLGISHTGRRPPLAHDLSDAVSTLRLQTVTWEDLMTADLSRPFELKVIDDALAPDIFRGCTVRLDPARAPEAGKPVLVKDKTGAHYLRDYQVGSGGRWQAIARQRGFAPMDSEADGLEIVAVMKGFDWP